MALEAEDKRLTEVRKQILEQDETIRKMVLSAKDRYKIVKIGETEIRIRPTIPRDVRKEIEKITKSDSGVEESEHLMYDLISKMCLDDPFDKADTWEYIDNETGSVMSFLADVYRTALDTEAAIKSFRGV
jgi:hypothetical protein